MPKMYDNTKTWNPFFGCHFDCTYCVPSFKAQAKRRKAQANGRGCQACYDFKPHIHPERLDKIPKADIVFVAAYGDISFCPPSYTQKILTAIRAYYTRHLLTVFYLQSKCPKYFEQFLAVNLQAKMPNCVRLVTTLETNRDAGYSDVSNAPAPSTRARQFRELDWPRKVVTIEPMMAFDLKPFVDLIIDIDPEYVWLGFNTRPKAAELPEPSYDDVQQLILELRAAQIEVRLKNTRDMELPLGAGAVRGRATSHRQR